MTRKRKPKPAEVVAWLEAHPDVLARFPPVGPLAINPNQLAFARECRSLRASCVQAMKADGLLAPSTGFIDVGLERYVYLARKPHVDPALSNVSTSFTTPEYVGDRVLPGKDAKK